MAWAGWRRPVCRYIASMAYKRPPSRRRQVEGDTLPNALAALARTRERTLAEVDRNLAADQDETAEPGSDDQGPADDRVAFK